MCFHLPFPALALFCFKESNIDLKSSLGCMGFKNAAGFRMLSFFSQRTFHLTANLSLLPRTTEGVFFFASDCVNNSVRPCSFLLYEKLKALLICVILLEQSDCKNLFLFLKNRMRLWKQAAICKSRIQGSVHSSTFKSPCVTCFALLNYSKQNKKKALVLTNL